MMSEMVMPGRSGVYAAPRDDAPLKAAAEQADFAWLTVDLAAVGDKAQFLAACARGLGFPETFGGNWDALADCLQDFSWRPASGYVLRFAGAGHFAVAAPRGFATAVEILENAAMYWKDRGKTLIALFEGGVDLPVFPAA